MSSQTPPETPHEATPDEVAKHWIQSRGGHEVEKTAYQESYIAARVLEEREYRTISAVQQFYKAAIRLADSHSGSFGESYFVTVDPNKITLALGARSLVVDITDEGVQIRGRWFRDPSSHRVFSEVAALLLDISTKLGSAGARGTSYATRVYKNITRIEFNYPPVVIALEAYSNGPESEESFCVVNVIPDSHSLLWVVPPPSQSGISP